jgi:hypothetical protein
MFNHSKIAVLLITLCLPMMAFATTVEQLESAASKGQVCFVVVTEPGAAGMDQANQLIQDAMAQISGSVMFESNRTDPANLAFVEKHKLAHVPVPLVLVFTSNGLLVGGNTASRLTAEKLVAMIPSPQKAEVLLAIQSGQAVYVAASRPGMASTAEIAEGCVSACAKLPGKCVAVDINMDDPSEQTFLGELGVDLKATEPVTVVINAKGQVTDLFTGAVEVDKLVASATKVAASSCCPTGSGKTCPPPAKKKEGK